MIRTLLDIDETDCRDEGQKKTDFLDVNDKCDMGKPDLFASPPPPTPPRAVARYPEPPKAAAPPVPDQPALNPVGTIFGSGEGYTGFLDTTTHGIVRLKTSKGEHGWVLRSVTDREAVLEKNYRTVVVRLPTITGDRQ